MNKKALASITAVLLAVSFFILTLSGTALSQTEEELKDALVKAVTLTQQGRPADAVPHFEVLVKAIPDEPKLRMMYGYALLARSKQIDDNNQAKKLSAEALVQFTAAKDLGMKDPQLDSLIKLLGGTTTGQGTGSGPALSEAEKLMQQAETAFAQSKYEEALTFYQKAFAVDPKIYEAALYSGDVYVQKQDWENAEKWYQKAISIDPLRETAYRYSATPLMKQKKFDLALDRYIEGYITEPYNKMSSRGITQWAEITGSQLGHPKVDIPNFGYGADGKPSTVMNETSLTEGSKAWVAYSLTRDAWHKQKFAKTFSNEKTYRHSLQEEVDAIRETLRSAREQKLSHPDFAILQKLDSEGLLEAFVLLALADEGISKDHPAYLKDNRAKLRQYVQNYVIHK